VTNRAARCLARFQAMTQDDQDLDAWIASLSGKPKDYLQRALGQARELPSQVSENDPKLVPIHRWIAALEAELAKS
jgi:hypothetical protein